MSRSLAAGTELYLCLRCEARSTFRPRSLITRTPLRRLGNTSKRGFSSAKDDVVESTEPTWLPAPVQASRSDQSDAHQLDNRSSERSEEGGGLRLSTTNDNQRLNLPGEGLVRRTRTKNRDGLGTHQGNGPSTRILRFNRHNSAHEPDRDKPRYPAHRHADVASDRVELGVERLGEPATIRVLPERTEQGRKEGIKRFRGSNEPKQNVRSETNAPMPFDNIVKTTNPEDEGTASTVEALNNIETLRKVFFESINQFEGATQEECHKLARSLEDGFTTRQLRAYQTFTISMKRSESDRLDTLSVTERYKVSRWCPGPSRWPRDSLRRLNQVISARDKVFYAILHSDGVDSEGYPVQNPKQIVINNILNLCWGLRPVEEKLQEGSVSLQIGRNWLALLLIQNDPIFQQVSRLFKVKTEISIENKLVRVSGTYDACVDAVRMITSNILAAHVEQLQLWDTSSKEQPSNAMLKEMTGNRRFWQRVEDQTLTKIAPVDPAADGTYSKVNVFYVSKESNGLVGVKRQISHLRRALQHKPIPCVCVPWSSQNIASLVRVPKSSDMALVDQNFSWYRWRSWLPSALNFDREKDAISITHFSSSTLLCPGDTQSIQIAKRLFYFWEQMRTQCQKVFALEKFTPDHWQPRPRTSIVASLGYLVHAIPDKTISQLQKNIDESFTETAGSSPTFGAKVAHRIFQHRRILTAGIPSLVDALTELISDSSTVSNMFKIVLVPSIVNGNVSIDAERLPTLEIVVSINESSKSTSLHRVCLVLNRQHVDLVLPKSASDARLTTETIILGRESNIDPGVTTFLKDCNLEVWGSGQFDTPSSLTMVLPKEICKLSGNWPLVCKKPEGLSITADNTLSKRSDEPSKKEQQPQQTKLEAAKSDDLHVDRAVEAADHPKGHGQSVTPTSKAGAKVAASGRASAQQQQELKVEYVFDSLAVHSSVESLYQGFPLSLSTIEAGQVGGRQQQVLEMETPGVADDMLQAQGASRKRMEVARAQFMAFYGSLSELISRLPK